MKKAIIIGATSGIGQEVAKCLLLDGWQIGVAVIWESALSKTCNGQHRIRFKFKRWT